RSGSGLGRDLRAAVALLGRLAGDAQGVGDGAPRRAGHARARDSVALEPVELAAEDGDRPQRVVGVFGPDGAPEEIAELAVTLGHLFNAYPSAVRATPVAPWPPEAPRGVRRGPGGGARSPG